MTDGQKKPKGAGKSSFELINSDILMEVLPVKPGSVVLDLACGKGIYCMFLSEIVGDTGLIYAVDLWEEGIRLIGKEIEEKNITNILPLLDDATAQIEIDDYSVDVCLMATVLHDFEEMNKSGAVIEQVKTILKPGGYLAVIEFKKIDGPPGPPMKIRLAEDDTEKMVSGYGFKKVKIVDIGEYNYLMIFKSIRS
ncbi:MAG: class I SAM-dependent methyltransferase [Desulfobacula sp.]|jgi:ubiquinone/menaquinone biosynthesis C-methylase UbiE|uniref:class I SAM-dependent methyltransferase n=3 Tax=Desulfobacula sp. TaxID=2593537 RepID=UPI001DBA3F8D|nr:class I SAM-dependent methyltransferase [Desulfobacula sp.]MBT4024493.1 class I SAM-dependent methyltransferase [Desulfobacula sp.]MBT5971290.1 class I SAM-dependent methyltransferase [Desulfobacula sp.]MBT6749653.1 class I SAM-dependent methyltransferase [Desulfobacula sp.]MBT7628712.1 class I SAM-dependent methyltransferase [Desulfobacula sp.]